MDTTAAEMLTGDPSTIEIHPDTIAAEAIEVEEVTTVVEAIAEEECLVGAAVCPVEVEAADNQYDLLTTLIISRPAVL